MACFLLMLSPTGMWLSSLSLFQFPSGSFPLGMWEGKGREVLVGVVLVGRADGGGRGAGGTRKGLGRLWVGVRETFGMEVEVGESIRLGREALGRVFSGDWAEECWAGYKDRRRLQWSLCGRKCAEFDVGGRACEPGLVLGSELLFLPVNPVVQSRQKGSWVPCACSHFSSWDSALFLSVQRCIDFHGCAMQQERTWVLFSC